MTAYSPLGSGATIDGHTVPTNPTLKQIGEAHGKSAAQVTRGVGTPRRAPRRRATRGVVRSSTRAEEPPQVAIAWLAQRGLIVIPKSVTAARVVANRDVDFALSDAEMGAVDGLNKDIRIGFGGPLSAEGVPRDAAHPKYPFGPGAAF